MSAPAAVTRTDPAGPATARAARAVPARPPGMRWLTAAPLWGDVVATTLPGDVTGITRPALLTFATDDFMTEFTELLARRPGDLSTRRAMPRVHRERPTGAPSEWTRPAATDDDLKLYQPFHGEYTLVVASLVCGRRGLPDHAVRPPHQRVGFVLRRLADDGGELAWASGSDGASGADGARRWCPVVGNPRQTLPGEELLPMFPVTYREPEPDGRIRCLHAGLVPTASRETYRTVDGDPAPPFPDDARGSRPEREVDPDPRLEAFRARVGDPLERLRALPPSADSADAADGAGEATAFLLLDLAELLSAHLPGFTEAMAEGRAPADTRQHELWHALDQDGVDWFRWLPETAAQWAVITGEEPGTVTSAADLRASTLDVEVLATAFGAALPDAASAPTQPVGLDAPKLDPTGRVRYAVRCVYRRPACSPTDLVGERSRSFAIAAVLDPDAPARPIRIPFPVDTGIAGLRGFRKNVGFMLSEQLRGQMARVKSLKDAMDGTLDDAVAWDLGVICQFSVPIIMICALMLLIVMVFVLNIVFFWVPFFRICIPVPIRSRR